MTAKTIDPHEINFTQHKFEDLRKEVKIEHGFGDYLRFTNYTGVQLPTAGAIMVRFRSWYEDIPFAETPLEIDPNDNRIAYMNLQSSLIETNRSRGIFFDCVGREKSTGLNKLIFYGVMKLKA